MNETNPISMPLLSYRFRLLYDDNVCITRQLKNVQVDLLNKTLTLSIIQPSKDDIQLFHTIYRFCEKSANKTSSTELTIEFVLNERIDTSITFTRCNVIKHNLELNYAKNDTANHELVVSFYNYRSQLDK